MVYDIDGKSLKEISIMISELEEDIRYWEYEKIRVFNSTQPKSIVPKQDIIQSSMCNDSMVNYVIRIEDIDSKIKDKQKQIDNLKAYKTNKLKLLGKCRPEVQKIITMRENGSKLDDIAEATSFSLSSVKRLLKDYYENNRIC